MEIDNRSNEDAKLPGSTDGLSRRNVLMTATVAAGAIAGAPSVLADTVPAGNFGAPLVELHFPAGALTLEQKSAMIQGVTDVLLNTTKPPPDQAKKLWVQVFETAEGGWGVGGQIFVPRSR
jgi:phenylpyruvate tautomerase PptA (4-oxalocrotonate tautomerase family)